MPLSSRIFEARSPNATCTGAIGAFGYLFTLPVNNNWFPTPNTRGIIHCVNGTFTNNSAGLRSPAIFFGRDGVTTWTYEWLNTAFPIVVDKGLPASLAVPISVLAAGASARIWPEGGLYVQPGDTIFVTELNAVDPLDVFTLSFQLELI